MKGLEIKDLPFALRAIVASDHVMGESKQDILLKSADAIEELLAAEPPLLWTDEPIEGTEFMTHSQGGRKGFEIHFRTDSLEKYKAVQEECRRQIDHAKPDPPKEVLPNGEV